MKTDIEITDELYEKISKSGLMDLLNGELRKNFKRKPDSDTNDVLIGVLANQNGKIQEATVNVNIYIKDVVIDDQSDEDRPKLRQVMKVASDFFEVIKYGNVRINLESQHYYSSEGEQIINNRLLYKVKN